MRSIKQTVRRGAVCLLAMLLTLAVVPTFSLSSAAASGKTYYVAANGTGDGSSAAKPMSYAQANATPLEGGDRMLFKRGDVFYGGFEPLVENTSNTSRVEIGAYGSGAKPIISRAKIVSSAWTNAGNGFFKFVLTKDGKYSGVNDDNANVGFMKDTKGNYYGRRFKTAAECTQQYDFYCDDTAIYVKSSKDPYAALGALTMTTYGCGVELCMGMNIHDLHIEHCGWGMDWAFRYIKYGTKSELMKFVHIYDCIIEDVGGTVSDVERHIRAGNCINLWQAGDNIVIENNILRNSWDVAFTPQGYIPGTWRNVTVRNNIIAYCTQALEAWSGSNDSAAGINVLNFTDNLCIKNGEGWGSDVRTTQSCDVLTYGYTAGIWRMSIKNNTFYHSEDGSSVYNIHPPAMDKFINNVQVDNNQTYQLSANSNYLFTRPNMGGPAEYNDLQINFAEWKELTGLDKNSKITYIGTNAKYRKMEQVALTSLDFDEIARAAKEAGLSFTLSYDAGGTVTTTTTTATTTATKTATKTTIGTGAGNITTATAGESTTATSSGTGVDGTETTQTASDPTAGDDPAATTTRPSEQTGAPADDGGEPTSVWLYIGIGGGVLLVAAAVAVWLIWKKKQG